MMPVTFTAGAADMITSTVKPDPARMTAALDALAQDQPVVMLNLLRYREQAQYKDGRAGGSGRDAYARYSELVVPMLKTIGARIVFSAKAKGMLIAPPEEQWDDVLLVQYPSVTAFKQMISSAEYLEATKHRTAALQDSRLIAAIER